MKKKNYWNNFYLKFKLSKPTKFAIFVKKNFVTSGKKKLIDIGCGNGRDSIYFSKFINVKGVDKSSIATTLNNTYVKKNNMKNISFFNVNVNSYKLTKLGKFDYIYSRFFLHAINSRIEKKLFFSLTKISKKNTLFFFEFRTTKDNLYKRGKKLSKYERYTDHYRRFINLDEFKKKITHEKKFSIQYLIEKRGLARFKGENPVVARIILKRK